MRTIQQLAWRLRRFCGGPSTEDSSSKQFAELQKEADRLRAELEAERENWGSMSKDQVQDLNAMGAHGPGQDHGSKVWFAPTQLVERRFWMDVYVATISQGAFAEEASKEADEAIRRLGVRALGLDYEEPILHVYKSTSPTRREAHDRKVAAMDSRPLSYQQNVDAFDRRGVR